MSVPARTAYPVVDTCSLLYDNAGWRAYLDRFRLHAPEYLDVFSASFCRYFGADHDSYRRALERDWTTAVRILVPEDRPDLDVMAHLRSRAEAGVVGEIVMGGPAILDDGRTVTERVLDLTAPHRSRIHVWASIRLGRPHDAVEQLRRAIASGASGACVIPFVDGTDAVDASHRDFFEEAEATGVPVWLHTGHHFAARQPSGLGSWRTVETLARRYPRLVIVAGHAGWPDVTEMLLTASRHPHVLLEFSSHRARGMPLAGSGWELALRQARTLGRGRMMFGSSTWVNPVDVARLAAEVQDLGLGDEVTREWLGASASARFGFDLDLDTHRPAA